MTIAQARELLADGWKLTQERAALLGRPIPDFIKFQIDGANHIRATRVAELDELAKAIASGRLKRPVPGKRETLVVFTTKLLKIGPVLVRANETGDEPGADATTV